jgi:hypothetical protein
MDELRGVTEVVINTSNAYYRLSEKAIALYLTYSDIEFSRSFVGDREAIAKFGPDFIVNGSIFAFRSVERDDPILVQVVKDLGKEANGFRAELKIVRLPKNISWSIRTSVQGAEWIVEEHRVWK